MKVIICSNKLWEIFLIGTKSSKKHTKAEIVQRLYEFFFSFVLFSLREEIGKVTICGNELKQSSLSQSLTSCVLNEQQM